MDTNGTEDAMKASKKRIADLAKLEEHLGFSGSFYGLFKSGKDAAFAIKWMAISMVAGLVVGCIVQFLRPGSYFADEVLGSFLAFIALAWPATFVAMRRRSMGGADLIDDALVVLDQAEGGGAIAAELRQSADARRKSSFKWQSDAYFAQKAIRKLKAREIRDLALLRKAPAAA